MFTARTTWVSNPFCAPSLHSSQSELFSQDAFAIVSPAGIKTFYRYPNCTSCVSQSQVSQFSMRAFWLSQKISQRTCGTCYECFRPNKCGCHLDRWDYRGGWHQSCPVLIRETFYISQKLFQYGKALWLALSRFRALQKIPDCCTP